jgi:hypothetical protein
VSSFPRNNPTALNFSEWSDCILNGRQDFAPENDFHLSFEGSNGSTIFILMSHTMALSPELCDELIFEIPLSDQFEP